LTFFLFDVFWRINACPRTQIQAFLIHSIRHSSSYSSWVFHGALLVLAEFYFLPLPSPWHFFFRLSIHLVLVSMLSLQPFDWPIYFGYHASNKNVFTDISISLSRWNSYKLRSFEDFPWTL
jgi:hypothetical protein